MQSLTWVVVPLGVAAAWLAAGRGWLAPLLWLSLLLACLTLPPPVRRLLDPRWLGLAAAVAALGWVTALDREAAVGHGLTFLAAAFLFALARLAAPSQHALEALAVGIAVTALPALAQSAGGLAHLAQSLEALPPGWREAAAARLASGRAFGTAALPGHFAALQLMVMPLLVASAVGARGAWRAGWVVLALLSCAGLAATRSLAALGVAAVVLAVAVARRRGLAVAAAGLVALGVVAASTLMGRGDLDTLEPVRLRLVNWQVAAHALGQHPWLGVGLGGVGQAGLAGPWGEVNITPFAHNSYLQLGAELGVAGAGVLLAALVALGRLLWRGWHQQLPLALAVLVVPLHNLVDFSAYAPEVLWPWAVLLGFLAARCGPPPRAVTPAPLLLLLLGGGLVMASLSFLAEARLAQAEAEGRAEPALAAAALTPWTVAPVLRAAELAMAEGGDSSLVVRVLGEVERRAPLRPLSASVAEARATLLLSLGRRGEALVWAGEARRRAPWRGDLAQLEQRCAPAP